MEKKTSGTELFIVDSSDQDWKVREYRVRVRPAGKASAVEQANWPKGASVNLLCKLNIENIGVRK